MVASRLALGPGLLAIAGLCLLGCTAGSGGPSPTGTAGIGAAGAAGNAGSGGAAGRAGAGSGGSGAGGNAFTGTAGSGGSGTAGSSAAGSGGSAGSAGTTGGGGAAGNSSSAGAGGSGGQAAAGTAGVSGAGGGVTGGRSGAGTGGGAAGATGATGGGGVTGVGGAGGAAASPCAARTGLLFCDDFEQAGTALAAPWTTSFNGSGTIAIDSTTPAHSGNKSVHVYGNGFQTLFVFHQASILPTANGRFYFRAYMRLGAAMTAGHNTFIIGDLAASPGGGNALRIGEQVSMLMYTVMGDSHGALSNSNYYNDGLPGVVFTPDTWACLEVLVDHGAPELDVWVDGNEVPDLHHKDFPLDSYDSLRFGFESYAGPASDIWYDDIAIGSARIGCN